MKKAELIKVLVDEYGYEKEDIKMLTNAKLKAMIKAEEEDAEEEAKKEKKNRVVKKKSKIDDDELIPVMNGLKGGLYYHDSQSNKVWDFKEFGQEDYMTYRELKVLRNRFPAYLNKAWLIVLDEEVQKEFGLTDKYENIITPDNVEHVFNLSTEELESFIDRMPDGAKSTFIGIAMDKYQKKEINSLSTVDMIERKFGFSLDDNAPTADVAVKLKKDGKVIYVDKK